MLASIRWFCPIASLIVAGVCCAGCGSEEPPAPPPPPQRMVYIDMATMKPLVHDAATSFPAVHPVTGKPTLRPALYCPTCKKWLPTPPIDQVNRQPGAGLCPHDKTPLTTDGPWPDGSAGNREATK